MIILTACNSKKKDKTAEELTETQIYYINKDETKIVGVAYTPIGTTKEELVEEYLTQLTKGPEDFSYKKAIPDNVIVKEFYFSDEDQLTVNFESGYDELKGIPEVLCRASIVKTLCQIKGLEYVEFYVNGQPLKDSNEQHRLMTKDDFIDSTGAEMKYSVSVYFANKEGNALEESNISIFNDGTVSMEKLVIQQLINGPTEKDMYKTIPEGTTLLNVTTKEGICYVDFSEKFLEKSPDVTDEIAIYSIVNSLVELTGINKVQFLINGEVKKIYRDETEIDGFFERNLSLIDGSN